MIGNEILNNPYLNKGCGFTHKEREELNLVGLLPPVVQSIEEQAEQAYRLFLLKSTDLEKREFLMELFNTNIRLFYYLYNEHLTKLNPIIYTPLVSDAVETYSSRFVSTKGAAFLDINYPENIEKTLKNAANKRNIRLIVVTDGEGILGIGDWGVNGVEIAVGKLMVYTVAAGIDPSAVLPVVIDAGTDNEKLLNDPFYLGNRHKRVSGERYDNFLDEFVKTSFRLFNDLFLHFEDFGRGNAARLLNKYNKSLPVFNDDIQGTGIVVLGAVFAGLKIKKEKLIDQVYLCVGAGSAGCGIADRVLTEMIRCGLNKEKACERFFIVDKDGLVFDDMPDLTEEQRPFAKKRSDFGNVESLTDLSEIVKITKATIIVGTSAKEGAFTKEVVLNMLENTERPMIFPISNPTKKAEAKACDIIRYSKGKALVATGTLSAPVEFDGVIYKIAQANNALIYPGLGLGMLASKARLLTDEMIASAAYTLSDFVDVKSIGASLLPDFERLREISISVGTAVFDKARKQNLAACDKDISEAIKDNIWEPYY